MTIILYGMIDFFKFSLFVAFLIMMSANYLVIKDYCSSCTTLRSVTGNNLMGAENAAPENAGPRGKATNV